MFFRRVSYYFGRGRVYVFKSFFEIKNIYYVIRFFNQFFKTPFGGDQNTPLKADEMFEQTISLSKATLRDIFNTLIREEKHSSWIGSSL